MASPTEITPQQLARLIGTADAPALFDLRIDSDFALDPHLIPGATRHRYDQIIAAIPQINGKAVLICHAGAKISQGAAAILRSHGIMAETLMGGYLAWRAADMPLIRAAAIPPVTHTNETLWVTRHRPKIDRIACPWLIRRFIDPRARFLFVEPAQVEAVADRFNATPFDMPGGFWSHRGDQCSFDTMLAEFGLQTPALDRLALIIRAADTNRHDLAPEAAGLLAASLGLSRIYRDDVAQMEAGLALYDAFYRWARDAQSEGHDWPAPVTQ